MPPIAPELAYTLLDQELMSHAKNYFAWQGRLVTRELGQRVIETGCGMGNFTGTILDRELVVSVDQQADCVERLRERYSGATNLETLVCDATDAEFRRLARFRPDSCVCLNVLEHIEDDRGALEAMASLLQPAGVIVLLLPAFPALYGPIDRNLGHYRRYTPGSVRRLAAVAGLSVKKMHYFNAAGFFGWWVNARILKLDRISKPQIEVFDRLVVPWLSRAESVASPPFGQSLFVVLERR